MRDYYYKGTASAGQRIAIAELPTAEIEDLLREGFVLCESDGQPDTIEGITERLRLELHIRALGLR